MSLRILKIVGKMVTGTLLALLLLLLGVGLVEAGFRLAGYGTDPKFWRLEKDRDGKEWVRENRDFTALYFAEGLRRRPHPFRIPRHKEPGVMRVFVLGSSAAMGDPDASFGMARMLEQRLAAAYPGKVFEVVNAAVTAINSNVVLRIAEDCAELEPDLFVVYEGNNEVIGPFGPGTVLTKSLQSPRAVALTVTLRKLRCVQWLRSKTEKQAVGGEWGGMEMFLKRQVASDDPRLESTAALFASNLRGIREAATKAGARTVFATVVVNLRDFPPFLSSHARGFSEANLQEWTQADASARQFEERGDLPGASGPLRSLAALDPLYAESHYRLGRALLAGGDPAAAAKELARARDEDTLRFRTDSRLNDVIRAVARETGGEWSFVDVAGEVAKRSRDRVPGDEWLYEHVHLSFKGTAVVSELLFDSAVKALGLAAMPPGGRALDAEALRERLAFTLHDQAMIFSDLRGRFEKPPFSAQSNQKNRREHYALLARRASELLLLPGSAAALEEAYLTALKTSRDDWVLQRNFGMALLATGKLAEAEGWLEKSRQTIPDDVDLLASLLQAKLRLKKDVEAVQVGEALRRLEPRHPALELLKGAASGNRS